MVGGRDIKGYDGFSKMRDSEIKAWINLLPNTGTVLEIGTLMGVSCGIASKAKPNLKFICLDISPAYFEWKRNRTPNMNLFVGTSINLAEIVEEKFDHIYIDGSHLKEWVLIDLECALKMIKPNGIICGHEYYENKKANEENIFVREALIESGKPFEIVSGSLWKLK